MNFKRSSLFMTLLGTAACLIACGDENTTKVYENHFDGAMGVLDKGEKLSAQKCDKDSVGKMLFVMDSSEAYFCDGKSWQTFSEDVDVKEEKTADNICVATAVKDAKKTKSGTEIKCGDVVLDTIWSGVDGTDGSDGKSGVDGSDGSDGKSGVDGSDGSDGKSGVDGKDGQNGKDGKDGQNGQDGKDGVGCEIVNDENGIVDIVCGEKAEKTRLYKAMCDVTPYDPEEFVCEYGMVLSKEGKNENFRKGLWKDERDGKIYKTVMVGGDVWMAENLNFEVKNVREGDVFINSACAGGPKGEKEGGDCDVYGRVYTYGAAKIACPDGWDLPEKEDLNSMLSAAEKAVSGESAISALKAKDTWEGGAGSHISGGSNSLGFSIVASGTYATGSGYDKVGEMAYIAVDKPMPDDEYEVNVVNGVSADIKKYMSVGIGFHSAVRCVWHAIN